MTTDLDVFEDIVSSIMDGTYEDEISDPFFLDKCRDLQEDAEIFAALNPDKSGYYLIQRKLIVYRIISKITIEKVGFDNKQKERLEFIEKGLLSLYWLYMELLVEIKH
ncbi:hypothetical protein SAMN04487898_104265 [Pedobacter sp. ok626]|uniref:hypothetical protein n=1 Tax=Pedobacter sp. ok626 TaxID=1761882 RepID=UPI00088DA12D|nr:hypothetical protein [Pedobacter sp. ok626]SDJ78229.1 hypothetical protein SAMN04487898_104265 [Pedobacter sp. ok626]